MSLYSVGQKVWMQSGPLRKEGTVMALGVPEIEDDCVTVELAHIEGERGYAISFALPGKTGNPYKDSRQRVVWINLGTQDARSWYDCDHRPLCTEYGPWELEL